MKTVLVNGERLPKHCECGGVIEYSVSFNRVWSSCKKCTPVEVVDVHKLSVRGKKQEPQ